jgi:hypothetical protein
MANRADALVLPEHAYDTPTGDAADLAAEVQAAIAAVPDLHEAWLVTRRTVYRGREKTSLGVVAYVGGRWRSRRQLDSLRNALQVFYAPSWPARLQWGSFANSRVPDDVRAVGIRLI